jgi:hypothetical protein
MDFCDPNDREQQRHGICRQICSGAGKYLFLNGQKAHFEERGLDPRASKGMYTWRIVRRKESYASF